VSTSESIGSVTVRSLEDTDIGAITSLDEKVSGEYRPDVWEARAGYYLRRDPESSAVAEVDGKVVGFMLGEVRSGEFGPTTYWSTSVLRVPRQSARWSTKIWKG
jgi:ribosomal protein S18 acetylase RimI-like enzyme